MTLSAAHILVLLCERFASVLVPLLAIVVISRLTRSSAGTYGRIFDSATGIVGFSFVAFWIGTAVLADWIAVQDPLIQIPSMQYARPGAAVPGVADAPIFYLLGGDSLGRDVFSRMVYGAREVALIAPTAALLGYSVGVMLGLPAGYVGGPLDEALSFIANLTLAFPVILLFYLLVSKDIAETGLLTVLSGVIFAFPVAFFVALWGSRYYGRTVLRWTLIGTTLLIGCWVYAGLVFNADPLDVFSINPNLLNVFVAVVFANAPVVFRIVRGLTLDLKSRDYIAAAQTRGEGPWYIMLCEILPNAQSPLIVDFCLRIGYTTILLGTLGFFGLGVSPESPDWGSTINDGRRLISLYPHVAVAPALALMSLVLGLNLLADAMREKGPGG